MNDEFCILTLQWIFYKWNLFRNLQRRDRANIFIKRFLLCLNKKNIFSIRGHKLPEVSILTLKLPKDLVHSPEICEPASTYPCEHEWQFLLSVYRATQLVHVLHPKHRFVPMCTQTIESPKSTKLKWFFFLRCFHFSETHWLIYLGGKCNVMVKERGIPILTIETHLSGKAAGNNFILNQQ